MPALSFMWAEFCVGFTLMVSAADNLSVGEPGEAH